MTFSFLDKQGIKLSSHIQEEFGDGQLLHHLVKMQFPGPTRSIESMGSKGEDRQDKERERVEGNRRRRIIRRDKREKIKTGRDGRNVRF